MLIKMANIESQESSFEDGLFEHLVGQLMGCVDEGLDEQSKAHTSQELDIKKSEKYVYVGKGSLDRAKDAT